MLELAQACGSKETDLRLYIDLALVHRVPQRFDVGGDTLGAALDRDF